MSSAKPRKLIGVPAFSNNRSAGNKRKGPKDITSLDDKCSLPAIELSRAEMDRLRLSRIGLVSRARVRPYLCSHKSSQHLTTSHVAGWFRSAAGLPALRLGISVHGGNAGARRLRRHNEYAHGQLAGICLPPASKKETVVADRTDAKVRICDFGVESRVTRVDWAGPPLSVKQGLARPQPQIIIS
jgi:hypothetical protein